MVNTTQYPETDPVPLTIQRPACELEELPVAYIEMDIEGRISYANRAARDVIGQEEGMLGLYTWDRMPAKEREESRQAYAELLRSGNAPPVVRRSVYTLRGYRTLDVHRSIIRDDKGQPMGMRSIALDVTDTVMAHEEAQQARSWLESVLESVPEAVIVTDALGFIRNTNQAAEHLFGWKIGELVGQPVEKKIPILHSTSATAERLSFQMALHGPARAVATVLDRDRHELQVEVSASPIVDKVQGFTTGVVGLWRRISNPQV
ncbi:MAG TPA: PAS domain-containing protein [Terracidiphilus sp.]